MALWDKADGRTTQELAQNLLGGVVRQSLTRLKLAP